MTAAIASWEAILTQQAMPILRLSGLFVSIDTSVILK
jgi:hypothetical protein